MTNMRTPRGGKGWMARQRDADERRAEATEQAAERAAIQAQRNTVYNRDLEARFEAEAERQRLHAQPIDSAVETIKRLPPDALTDFLKIVHGRGFDWNAYRTELTKMYRAAGLHGM